MMEFDPEWVFNKVLEINRQLQVLNTFLDNASEKNLETIREMKDPSRGDNYPNFFAVAIQGQAEKLVKTLERTE